MLKRLFSNIVSIALGLYLSSLFVPGVKVGTSQITVIFWIPLIETILIIWIINIIISKIIKAE